MDTFTAIADTTRRRIIELLAAHGPLSATEICSHFEISPQAISQHLKVLREANAVSVEKKAQQRIYRLNPESMSEVEDWAKQFREMWSQRFQALDRLLEARKAKQQLHTNPMEGKEDS
ncbi:ArsR/SmtB family transcription factor [Cohnella nanjingensis]|uniref:Winged helix-turn-helix transcriptional regulator n=1 Tax=Cohnella nanjingensis TaxID=1387779 RepID=A0A7X0RMQ5_9BACL|nr:metalloregulator ArsR/SmtB family transcription factor [Cohnella nanjingensis]MBB6670364.1 winged helix-turn-helix transcriptional regulator [Cohnella nanjingensis]